VIGKELPNLKQAKSFIILAVLRRSV